MLTFKNKKETLNQLAHVDVYSDGAYIGYYIKNNSLAANENENWNFVSEDTGKVPHFPAKTKQALIQELESFLEVSK